MIAVLLIVYSALVAVLFKLKLLKPRPVPIAGCVVVGILMIGSVLVFWFQSSPTSSRVVTVQPVVTLVPYVKGQVLKIHAVGNQPVKKGDVLLEINPEPYQFTVNQVEAQLKASKDNVKQSQAGLESAQANVAKAKASVTQARAGLVEAKAAVANAKAAVAKAKSMDDLARTEEQIALKLQKADAGAISELKVVEAQQKRQANDAALKQAEAGLGQAQAGQTQAEAGVEVALSGQVQAEAGERQAGFAVQMAHSNVTAAEAQVDTARFNLRECKIFAPADGYVVNWAVQVGTMVLAGPMAPAGTFIVTSETFIVAAFPQNHLTKVQPGDEVEMVLNPYPGRLFKAKVEVVVPATGEGQFNPSGQVPFATQVGSQGMFAVKIRLTDDDPSLHLPLGAGGTVAIYTDSGKAVQILSKVTIRMKRWMLYVIPS